VNWNRALAATGGLWLLAVVGVFVVPEPVVVALPALLAFCAGGFVVGVKAARIGTGVWTRRAWYAAAITFPLHLGVLALFRVGGSSFPSPADVVRMVIVGLLLFAGFALPLRTTTPLERRKAVFDVLTVGVAASMVVWFFVAGPYVGSRSAVVVAAAVYPVLDLLLLFGVSRLLMRGTVSSGPGPVVLLTAAVIVQFVADARIGYYAAHSMATDRDATSQMALTLTHLALLTGALVIRCAEREDPAALAARCLVRAKFPYVAILLGYGLMVLAAVQEHEAYPWSGLIVGALVITGLVVARQLTLQRESDQAAATDGLTGLANRAHLREQIVQALERGAKTGRVTAVLLVDMNGFKQVNDTRGHKAGDELLVGMARILRDAVLGADTVGRLGGDEFAVLLHDIGSEANAEAVARRIIAGTGEPIMIDGAAVPASASIGIALSRPGQLTAEELLHRADTAMYHAKRRGGDPGYACYADTMGGSGEPSLEDELRTAVAAGELRLVFQPIVGLPDEELCGIEALCRWEHPRLGLLEADAFIPLAERCGIIGDLGRWVLREACSYARRWPQLPLHVNVSGRQLHDDGFSAEVRAIVRETGLKPEQLVLEVTENQLIADEVPRAHLEILNDEGIRIALDDFGTGYSSLSNLTRLPIDMLKLDREFVATLDNSAEGAAVAQSVLRLGRVLGMDTIAEGVETAAQARELTLLGATRAQGHYFARPQFAEQIDERIAAWSDNRYGRSLRA
jgi:diguanylate cyclase